MYFIIHRIYIQNMKINIMHDMSRFYIHYVPAGSILCQKYAFILKNLQFLPNHYKTLSK